MLKVEDGVVLVEDVLRAVAVVIIEVDDEHAADAVDLLEIARGDGDVVEDAEAHAAVARCMMARRPNGTERILQAAGHHAVDGVQHAAGGCAGGGKRLARDVGVSGAQRSSRPSRSPAHASRARCRHDRAQAQVQRPSRARRNPNEILREPRFVESAQHRRETFGPFRMARVAGVVPQIEVVEQESGRSAMRRQSLVLTVAAQPRR